MLSRCVTPKLTCVAKSSQDEYLVLKVPLEKRASFLKFLDSQKPAPLGFKGNPLREISREAAFTS